MEFQGIVSLVNLQVVIFILFYQIFDQTAIMDDDSMDDSFPDLNELENKIGMKTPESLLAWMKDASGTSEWRERKEDVTQGNSFNDKIKYLKFEMGCLRAADVRILRQLMAVHEGVEAVRWLLEERSAPASRTSSVTGSQNSLAETSPPAGTSSSPSPEEGAPSPTLTTGLLHLRPHNHHQDPAAGPGGDETPRGGRDPAFTAGRPPYFDMLRDLVQRAGSGPVSARGISTPGGSDGTQSRIIPGTHRTTTCLPGADRLGPHSPPLPRLQRAKTRIDLTSAACSRDAGKGLRLGMGTGPTLGRNVDEEEEEEGQSLTSSELLLLGYDAQWSWVDSQDDVTFL